MCCFAQIFTKVNPHTSYTLLLVLYYDRNHLLGSFLCICNENSMDLDELKG